MVKELKGVVAKELADLTPALGGFASTPRPTACKALQTVFTGGGCQVDGMRHREASAILCRTEALVVEGDTSNPLLKQMSGGVLTSQIPVRMGTRGQR